MFRRITKGIGWSCALSCIALLTLLTEGSAGSFRVPASQWAGMSAQTSSPVKGVRVYGSTRFTPQQILRASGLHIGEMMTDTKMRQAQQRLADTGAFTDVGADDFPGMGGVVLHFNLNDMRPLAVCDFSQIHGVDAGRLTAELKREVPLFDGRVPLPNPRMLNAVQARLGQILKRQGVRGKVETMLQPASPGSSSRRIIFHIVGE